MNDRELQTLIRMAAEAEALEHSGEMPALRLAGRGPRRWAAGLGIASAAAAGLAIAFVLMRPANVPSGGSLAEGPGPVPVVTPEGEPGETRLASAAPAEECVVMAVYRGPDGQCSCLELKEAQWGGRPLAEVQRRELLDLALAQPCSRDAQQVLVVAVEGKREVLPDSREEAEAIAARLAEAPVSGRYSDVTAYAYAAMPDLPPDATVVAERVAVRGPSPLHQAAALIGQMPGW